MQRHLDNSRIQAALRDPTQLGPSRPAAVPEFEAQAVVRAVRGIKRASAPGPTGLRPDHLREALQTARADEVAAHLALLSHTLARGEAPRSVAPFLAGASLHALPEKTGGVRPIAVGEVLRRLVGKLLCEAVREEARECLWPLQVGVGVKDRVGRGVLPGYCFSFRRRGEGLSSDQQTSQTQPKCIPGTASSQELLAPFAFATWVCGHIVASPHAGGGGACVGALRRSRRLSVRLGGLRSALGWGRGGKSEGVE